MTEGGKVIHPKSWSKGWDMGFARGLERAKALIDQEFERAYKKILPKKKKRGNQP